MLRHPDLPECPIADCRHDYPAMLHQRDVDALQREARGVVPRAAEGIHEPVAARVGSAIESGLFTDKWVLGMASLEHLSDDRLTLEIRTSRYVQPPLRDDPVAVGPRRYDP